MNFGPLFNLRWKPIEKARPAPESTIHPGRCLKSLASYCATLGCCLSSYRQFLTSAGCGFSADSSRWQILARFWPCWLGTSSSCIRFCSTSLVFRSLYRYLHAWLAFPLMLHYSSCFDLQNLTTPWCPCRACPLTRAPFSGFHWWAHYSPPASNQFLIDCFGRLAWCPRPLYATS